MRKSSSCCVALLVVQTFELNLEIIPYINFFVLQSLENCFKFKTQLTAQRRCKHTDFVFTQIYLQKHPLISVSELCGPKTTSLTPFSFRLDTWSFSKEIKGKMTRETACLNNFSFTMSKNVQYKRPVKLSPDPFGDRDD